MKPELIRQLEGYEAVAAEINAAQKYGTGLFAEKGRARELIERLHPARLSLKVSEIINETPLDKTFRLVARSGVLPPFQAGQYLSLSMDVDGVRTTRPFSISSSPRQRAYYDVTVRRVPGGLVSNFLLDRVREGDSLESSGPSGTFVFNPLIHGNALACVAGGSGITPFMSMVREIRDAGLSRRVVLFHGSKNKSVALFLDELLRTSKKLPNFHYVPVMEEPGPGWKGASGLMDQGLFQAVLGDLGACVFFLCGPQGMYDFCVPELLKQNVPQRKIRVEMYGPPAEISKQPGWPEGVGPGDEFSVSVKGRGTVSAKAGVSLLASLEKGGLLLPSVCRSGECSYCRVRVLSGRVYEPAQARVRKSDRQFGYVHACAAYPIENLEILI